MSGGLRDKLAKAGELLGEVRTIIAGNPGVLPEDAANAFIEVSESRASIGHLVGLIDARDEARKLLDRLEETVDGDDSVRFGESRAKYGTVRFLGVQAYVTTTWALADRIAGLVGQILCSPEAGANPLGPATLVKHFIQDERKKSTTAAVGRSIRKTYGWPIGVSYAVRNHFVHDGAELRASSFFSGSAAASGFEISDEGWAHIERRAQRVYGVDSSYQRDATTWPVSPQADLRVVFAACEREMDDALGVLLGTACHLVRAHVGFMVGEEF